MGGTLLIFACSGALLIALTLSLSIWLSCWSELPAPDIAEVGGAALEQGKPLWLHSFAAGSLYM